MRHRVARIGREDVARKHSGEPLGIGRYGVRNIRVVVSITRRRLNQSGFPDSSPVLLHDQPLNAYRALLGPA